MESQLKYKGKKCQGVIRLFRTLMIPPPNKSPTLENPGTLQLMVPWRGIICAGGFSNPSQIIPRGIFSCRVCAFSCPGGNYLGGIVSCMAKSQKISNWRLMPMDFPLSLYRKTPKQFPSGPLEFFGNKNGTQQSGQRPDKACKKNSVFPNVVQKMVPIFDKKSLLMPENVRNI